MQLLQNRIYCPKKATTLPVSVCSSLADASLTPAANQRPSKLTSRDRGAARRDQCSSFSTSCGGSRPCQESLLSSRTTRESIASILLPAEHTALSEGCMSASWTINSGYLQQVEASHRLWIHNDGSISAPPTHLTPKKNSRQLQLETQAATKDICHSKSWRQVAISSKQSTF